MDMEGAKDPAAPTRTFPQVTIYTSSDCRWCGPAKEYLAEHGVPYTEKNVETDDAVAQEAFNLAGQRRQTPVIAVGSRVVVGFQMRELDEALGF